MNDTPNNHPNETAANAGQPEDIEQRKQPEQAEPGEPPKTETDAPEQTENANEPEKPKIIRGTAEGVVDPRADAPKEDLQIEDKLELATMTRKERRAIKRKRYKEMTDGMSRKERFRYFLYAYKTEIFIPLITIICASIIIVALVSNSKPAALSYAVINCEDLEALDTSVISEDYMNYYDYGSGYAINQVLDLKLSLDASDMTRASDAESANYLGFPTMCQENYYDVAITDDAGLAYMLDASLLHTLDDACSKELSDALTKNCSDRIISYTDTDGVTYAYAIDISGTDFAQKLNVGYTPIYLCFPGNSEDNRLNISRLCNFIFGLGLSIK